MNLLTFIRKYQIFYIVSVVLWSLNLIKYYKPEASYENLFLNDDEYDR